MPGTCYERSRGILLRSYSWHMGGVYLLLVLFNPLFAFTLNHAHGFQLWIDLGKGYKRRFIQATSLITYTNLAGSYKLAGSCSTAQMIFNS